MAPLRLISALFEQASAQGSRSTVLRPLGWLIAICSATTLSVPLVNGPSWLLELFAVLAALGVILYLGAYVYCLATDKETLRSETYSIQKLAIEKGFVGDSSAGVFPVRQNGQTKLIAGEVSRGAEEHEGE